MKCKPSLSQTRITIRIPAELDKTITLLCKKYNTSKSDLIRKCITTDFNNTTPFQQEIRDALAVNRMVSIMKLDPKISNSQIQKIVEEFYGTAN